MSEYGQHGSITRYFEGCKCPLCAATGRVYWHEYNRRTGRVKDRQRGAKREYICRFCAYRFRDYPSRRRVYCSLDCTRAAQAAYCKHGTRSRYNAGCRCAPCTAANRDRARKYRAKVRAIAAASGGRKGARP